MATQNTSAGLSSLIHAIKQQYSELSDSELEELRNIILGEVGRRLSAGERLAFLRTNEEGNMELTVLGLEILDKKKERSGSKAEK